MRGGETNDVTDTEWVQTVVKGESVITNRFSALEWYEKDRKEEERRKKEDAEFEWFMENMVLKGVSF